MDDVGLDRSNHRFDFVGLFFEAGKASATSSGGGEMIRMILDLTSSPNPTRRPGAKKVTKINIKPNKYGRSCFVVANGDDGPTGSALDQDACAPESLGGQR